MTIGREELRETIQAMTQGLEDERTQLNRLAEESIRENKKLKEALSRLG